MVEKDVGVKFKIYRDDTKVPEEISLIILESEVQVVVRTSWRLWI